MVSYVTAVNRRSKVGEHSCFFTARQRRTRGRVGKEHTAADYREHPCDGRAKVSGSCTEVIYGEEK